MSRFDEVELELRRVVERLNSMPLNRAESAREDAYATAAFVVARSRELDSSIPPADALPRVGVSACGAQLAVVSNDYLRLARQTPDSDPSAVVEALVNLRRRLP